MKYEYWKNRDLSVGKKKENVSRETAKRRKIIESDQASLLISQGQRGMGSRAPA